MATAAPAAAPTRGTHGGMLIGTSVMAVALIVAPLVGIYPVFLMKALCFALFACAFNLLLGFGGLLSFGHAMFLGTAGYVCAHAAKVWGLSPELAIALGTLAAAALGAVVGALAIRRQGIYFAMITLAVAQMMYFFYVQAPFTHGEDGIQAVPRGRLFGLLDLSQPLVIYYVVLTIFIAAFLLIYRITGSGFLHHMVRNLVGTFVEAGRDRLAADSIPLILTERNRSAAGPTAPASGLFLVEVEY